MINIQRTGDSHFFSVTSHFISLFTKGGEVMADRKSSGRGWHGDSKGHAAAGQKGGRASRKRKQGNNNMQQDQSIM